MKISQRHFSFLVCISLLCQLCWPQLFTHLEGETDVSNKGNNGTDSVLQLLAKICKQISRWYPAIINVRTFNLESLQDSSFISRGFNSNWTSVCLSTSLPVPWQRSFLTFWANGVSQGFHASTVLPLKMVSVWVTRLFFLSFWIRGSI